MEGGEDAESTTTMVVAVEVGGERGRGQMTDRQTGRESVQVTGTRGSGTHREAEPLSFNSSKLIN